MLKRYIFKCLPLIFLFNSIAYTHGPVIPTFFDDPNYGFYIHPISLIYGWTKPEMLFYAMLVAPLPIAFSALAITPSYLNKENYYSIGSGIGYRIFLYRDYYFQLTPGVHYLKYDDGSSGPMINVLGYIGMDIVPAMDFNVGVGYKWNLVTKTHGLAIDGNLGIDPFVTLVILLAPVFLLLNAIYETF